MSEDKRIIKKYSNRRLYDTTQSRYVTLDELKEMVFSGIDFQVLTTKGEDITSQTLIGILLAADGLGQSVFSEGNLRNMVLFMNGPMRGPVRVFFEQCLPLFAQAQQRLVDRFGSAVDHKELENLAVLQGNFVRRVMEQYVCQGLENYLATQERVEKMMSMQPFSFPNIFNPMANDKKDDNDS